MNYTKHYNKLIERARNRKLTIYKECHHIIPRCLGGTNDPNNIVELTGREHYIAHQLLIKIYPNNVKLVYAAKMMRTISPTHRGNRSQNRIYEWLRELYSRTQSAEAKLGYINNPNYGMKNKRHSDATKLKQKEASSKPHKIVTCPKCGKSGGLCNMSRYHFENCGKSITIKCPYCDKVGGIGIMKRWHFDKCKYKES